MADMTSTKQEFLLIYYKMCSDQMSWRRTAGYRTIIIGLGYCALLIAVVAFNHSMNVHVRECLAVVISLASIFGAGWLVHNYQYFQMDARQMVRIEEYIGMFEADFLGPLGPLMTPARKQWANVSLSGDFISLCSVLIFLVGGLGTAAAIMLM